VGEYTSSRLAQQGISGGFALFHHAACDISITNNQELQKPIKRQDEHYMPYEFDFLPELRRRIAKSGGIRRRCSPKWVSDKDFLTPPALSAPCRNWHSHGALVMG
jgi:hypothetical protein